VYAEGIDHGQEAKRYALSGRIELTTVKKKPGVDGEGSEKQTNQTVRP